MSEQHVFRARRNYNRWVANQTLEDYALRFTAKKARRWSIARVSNTALGAISFLALEAIGGAITINYGFNNAITAIMVVSFIIFITGLPISYYAAKYGVDIDLLSRGAGFGYIGSTMTSLIYASFTFIFFALEAAIMSSALELLFDIPLSIAYVISSLIVIPLATHGITFISRFQLWSQPLWIALQLAPLLVILVHDWSSVEQWVNYPGEIEPPQAGVNLIYFGAASAVLFSLIAQIGEQVDFLRFLPECTKTNRRRWWLALVSAGPGWIIVGALKIAAGSFLAVLAINHGVGEAKASDPIQMYLIAFTYLASSPASALAIAGIFVIVCQLKINVTNAYAGSIAWSNFFSRLTRSHPGRVVWLVFNVIIALLLMEMGVYEALENTLGIYSNVAVAWVGALVADLVINKPLGFSPKHIEFKRAHLYDINPVGFGSMILASALGITSYMGFYGESVQALAPFISLFSAFVFSPIIAILTKGKYYIARQPDDTGTNHCATCKVCRNEFEHEDIATCPAYGGAICSLCCSIDSRCHDICKAHATMSEQVSALGNRLLPTFLIEKIDRRLLYFTSLLIVIGTIIATLFLVVYDHGSIKAPGLSEVLSTILFQMYVLLIIVVGVVLWLFVLANESRQLALEESETQTQLLSQEIIAHQKTDAELQKAKEAADAANQAKSRYLTGISHELRSPLNSILGYAQLLENDPTVSESVHKKICLIRRSGDHLADLIEGLLDISMIEAGKMEMRRDVIAINVLISELIQMFSLQAKAKGIEFTYLARSRLPEHVIAHEKPLRQILINLLSNAVKYTPHGKVTLSVGYRNQVAEFRIKDSGVGIAKNEVEKIFQPFERIRKPGEAQSPGTGLGLTISKFLTEIMGGDISVKSVPNQGSEFKLSLMLPRPNHPVSMNEPHMQIDAYEGPVKTIMVVDDDASHRELIKEILTPLGFIVVDAEDAESCLRGISKTKVDCFLLDISMPDMNGWQLLRHLRQRKISVPIIMVSADAMLSSEYNSWIDGQIRIHDDYIVKPIKNRVLVDKVGGALNITWLKSMKVPEKHSAVEMLQSVDTARLFRGVSETDCREVISMAELGFVSGIEEKLNHLESSGADFFAATIRPHLSQYRFSEIISLTRLALSK